MSLAAPGRRSVAALAAVLTGVGLAGCARTVDGHPSSTSVDLGMRLQRAMNAVTSAHLQMRVDAAGLSVTATGEEELADGTATALALTEDIGGLGRIKVIIVDGELYATLPAGLNPTDKPWVRVRPDTTDPALVPLAQALRTIQDSASLRQYTLFAQAAAHIRDLGPSHAHGSAAELYSFSVLVSRLPQGLPGAAALRASGLPSIPVQLWVDDKGRVLRMTETIAMGGQQTSTQLDLSRYDEPVSISAPPADQVATH